MNDSKLSVIVPVYNAEHFLHYCVDSLLRQTYKDLEIILVENGSKDHSYDCCKRYENDNSKIRAYHLEEAGVSNARNFGIKKASGKYIMFVDSDDYCEHDYCSKMVEAAVACKDKYMPVCGYQMVSDYHQKDKRVYCYSEQPIEKLPDTEILKIFKKGLFCSLWNRIFNREQILKNDLKLRTDLTLGEDLLFNLNYMNAIGVAGFYMINLPLYNYVQNQGSLTHKYYDNLWELTTLFLDELQGHCIKRNILDEDIFANIVYYYYIDLFQNTMSPANHMSVWEKFRYNNAIMQDERFRSALTLDIAGFRKSELWVARKSNYVIFFLYKYLKRRIAKLKVFEENR